MEVDANVDVEVDAGGVEPTDLGGDTQMQIDDPSGENFDYDGWSKDVFQESSDEIDLEAMEAEHEEGDQETDNESDDATKEGDTDDSKDEKESASDDSNEEKKKSETDQNKSSDQKIEVKLKVNGEDKTITDINEVQKLAQLGLASNEKFQAATNIQNQTRELFETLRDDPAKIFSNPQFGDKFKEAAEKYIYDELSLESLKQTNPAAYEAEMNKRELDQYKTREQTRAQQDEQRKINEQTNHYKAQFTKNLADIMEAAQLPDTKENRIMIGQEMNGYIKKGVPINPQEIAQKVSQGFQSNINQTLNNLDAKSLVEKLGPDAVEKIRKYNVEQHKKNQASTNRQSKPKVLNKNSDRSGSSKGKKKITSSADEMMDDVWSEYQ